MSHTADPFAPTEPKIEIIDVTPDLARLWLVNNSNNRNLRPRQVAAYADDMVNDRWQFNGDPIRFAADGQLLDGQHRLHAIMRAGVAVRLLVISGLSTESQDTMDAGAKRRASDQLTRRGVPNATFVAAVARLVILWDTYGPRKYYRGMIVSNAQILERADSRFCATLTQCHHYAREISAPDAIVGTCFYLFARVDPAAATRFFDSLASGADLSITSPILVLRNRLTKLRDQAGYLETEQYFPLFCRAWNYWRDGRTVSHIPTLRDNETFPEPH